jgi:signal transduction histidine kinase
MEEISMDAPQLPQTTQYVASRAPLRSVGLVRQSAAAATAAAAAAAEKRRDVYLATVAHEMRNAMGPLTCAIDILALRAADIPEMGDLAPVVRRQLRQLAKLTEDLLDLGRASNGEFRMTFKPEPAQDIVRGVAAAWSVLARMKGQAISLDMPPQPLVVLADRVRLGQAIQNIVANAIKFTPEGGTIAVSVIAWDKGLQIRVVDSGIGIAAGDLDRIFELFYSVRGDEVPAGGFGIGLALAARLVELHGGSISASSEGSGKGTAFTIALPLAAASRAS